MAQSSTFVAPLPVKPCGRPPIGAVSCDMPPALAVLALAPIARRSSHTFSALFLRPLISISLIVIPSR